ncbi:MAG: TIGR02391 family protein [Caldilineaceae bacterium]|nr:TIGR02391 family protein [Caldilineaceae bacterium]
MDDLSSGRDIAFAMSSILRKLGEVGFEGRRVSPSDTANRSLERFDELVTNKQIRLVSGPLFKDGHFARAVEEAFKCLNNAVKDKSGNTGADGAGLMKTVFSANSPVLKLNSFQSQSERDEQLGYMEIFSGSMTGIRNPRAHEHSLVDEPDVALELVILANHLMRKLDAASK